MTKRQEQISKTVSFALRHRPDFFSLTLDPGGWVSVGTLTKAVSRRLDYTVERKDIEDIIALSEKKRFEFDGDRIRATYGHSVETKIEFQPTEPPEVLYHGTSERAWVSIEKEGLKPMGRQYVHLSKDMETAKTVGKRHVKGNNEVLLIVVDSGQMHKDGFRFFHSGNDGTWMCEFVPPKYFLSKVLI